MSMEWNEQFSVGVSIFNIQHQQIFRLLNELEEDKTHHVDLEAFSETMTKLVQYSEQHLDAEERLMREHSYPDYESHRRQHSNYKKQVAGLTLAIMEHDPSTPQKILSFLTHWWSNHILNTDMQYKDFFAANGIR